MTDPLHDVDIDAFAGLGFGFDEPTADPLAVGAPDMAEEHRAAEQAALDALVTPVGVSVPAPAPVGRPEPSGGLTDDPVVDRLLALVFASRSGSDQPHIVTVHRDAEGRPSHVTCPCKAGMFNRRGCWAMHEAQALLGLTLS